MLDIHDYDDGTGHDTDDDASDDTDDDTNDEIDDDVDDADDGGRGDLYTIKVLGCCWSLVLVRPRMTILEELCCGRDIKFN